MVPTGSCCLTVPNAPAPYRGGPEAGPIVAWPWGEAPSGPASEHVPAHVGRTFEVRACARR